MAERELIGRHLTIWDTEGDPIQTIKEVEAILKPETLDIIRANRMSKTKQITGYEIPVKLVMSKLESRLRYQLLEDFKNKQTMVIPSITGKLVDKMTDNVERIKLTNIYIHGDIDLIVAKIDENKGIDITLEGTAEDFDFLDKFPDYMV
jgi:hypothetical protein